MYHARQPTTHTERGYKTPQWEHIHWNTDTLIQFSVHIIVYIVLYGFQVPGRQCSAVPWGWSSRRRCGTFQWLTWGCLRRPTPGWSRGGGEPRPQTRSHLGGLDDWGWKPQHVPTVYITYTDMNKYCTAGNFHHEKFSINFTTCLHWWKFYPMNFFVSCVGDYTEAVVTFTI